MDAAGEARPDASADTPTDIRRDIRPEAAAEGGATDAGADTPLDSPAVQDASDDTSGDAGADAGPLLVSLQFSGTVQTVAGTPLGLDSSARLAPVSGQFAYDLHVGDSARTDPLRGRYLHFGTSQFTFTVSGHTVTGSGWAIVETENLNPDTFRFRDGQQNDGVTRIMKLDGVDAPALVLLIAITDSSGAALSSDVEPDPFPFTNIASFPHTFSITDGSDGGSSTLLMQLDSIVML